MPGAMHVPYSFTVGQALGRKLVNCDAVPHTYRV